MIKYDAIWKHEAKNFFQIFFFQFFFQNFFFQFFFQNFFQICFSNFWQNLVNLFIIVFSNWTEETQAPSFYIEKNAKIKGKIELNPPQPTPNEAQDEDSKKVLTAEVQNPAQVAKKRKTTVKCDEPKEKDQKIETRKNNRKLTLRSNNVRVSQKGIYKFQGDIKYNTWDRFNLVCNDFNWFLFRVFVKCPWSRKTRFWYKILRIEKISKKNSIQLGSAHLKKSTPLFKFIFNHKLFTVINHWFRLLNFKLFDFSFLSCS